MRAEPAEPVDRAARRSPVLLVASLLMIGLSVLGGFVLRQDPAAPPWQGIDDAWHDLVRDPFPTEHSILDTIAIALNNFEALPGYLLFAALLVSMLLVRCWATAGYLVAVAAVGIGASQLLKVWVDRPRPPDGLVQQVTAAYPSGHSTLTACFIVLVAAVLSPRARRRWWWPVGILLLAAMMASRAYLSVHWLSDTIGGALLGLGCAILLWWAMGPSLANERRRRIAER